MKYSDLPRNKRTFTCSHIVEDDKEPLLVTTDRGGDIWITCGCAPTDPELVKLVGIGHMLEKFSGFEKQNICPFGSEFSRIGPGLPWQLKAASITFD